MSERLTIDGTLTVQTALVDFRDESALCCGVFRGDQTVLEVQYRVVLDAPMLRALRHGLVSAGVPLLRAPEMPAALVTDPSAGNGNGAGTTPATCHLCGMPLHGRAIPFGFCRICRTTRPAECVRTGTGKGDPPLEERI